jgi:hypothetical protein
MMERDIRLLRQKLDQMIEDNKDLNLLNSAYFDLDSLKEKYNLRFDDIEQNPALYAWVPAVTALCPSELGTTSSRTASCWACRSEEIPDDGMDKDNNPGEKPGNKPSYVQPYQDNPF